LGDKANTKGDHLKLQRLWLSLLCWRRRRPTIILSRQRTIIIDWSNSAHRRCH